MAAKLRWGILGTGKIAGKFAAQITACEHNELVAVGSRAATSAKAFAEEWNCEPCTGYPELLQHQQIDAVYVSLPNALHKEWSIAALEAGKHVLCEKPIATSALDAEAMFRVAEQNGLLLAEAFMYRCHPAVVDMLRRVQDGAIGDVRIIRTHFTYNRPADPSDVRYQRHLGGGALMDIGCYCVNLIQAITEQSPQEVGAVAHFSNTGVDDYSMAVLRYDNDILATMTCGMCLDGDRTTFINGTTGYIRMETPWFSHGTYELVQQGESQTITCGSQERLYALEARAMGEAIRQERSIWMPPEETVRNMKTLDNIRAAIGLSFRDFG